MDPDQADGPARALRRLAVFVAGALVIVLAVWGVVMDLPRTPQLMVSAVLITLGVAAAVAAVVRIGLSGRPMGRPPYASLD